MDIKKLQSLVVDALEDVKAQDITLFDTTHLTSLFDRIAIASGTSNRQTKALAASVRDKVKAAGGDVYGMEGEDTGEWVLVDLGDMIVHIMQAPIRAYYRLEELWGDKPVKVGAAKRKSTKEGEEADEPKKISSHLAAGKKSRRRLAGDREEDPGPQSRRRQTGRREKTGRQKGRHPGRQNHQGRQDQERGRLGRSVESAAAEAESAEGRQAESR